MKVINFQYMAFLLVLIKKMKIREKKQNVEIDLRIFKTDSLLSQYLDTTFLVFFLVFLVLHFNVAHTVGQKKLLDIS